MFNGVHSDRHIFGMTGCRLGIYQPNEPQKKHSYFPLCYINLNCTGWIIGILFNVLV